MYKEMYIDKVNKSVKDYIIYLLNKIFIILVGINCK